MANRPKKSAGLGLLSLWEVAQELKHDPTDLLRLPGFLALVFDLTGQRKPVRRMDEEDFDELMVRREELERWLQGLRYQMPAEAGAAA